MCYINNEIVRIRFTYIYQIIALKPIVHNNRFPDILFLNIFDDLNMIYHNITPKSSQR